MSNDYCNSWDEAQFEQQLRRAGTGVSHLSPVQRDAELGQGATREQIQGWVANRFYYQISIPRKDAAIIANCPDRERAAAVGRADSGSRRSWR